jgi:UPF0755 protein
MKFIDGFLSTPVRRLILAACIVALLTIAIRPFAAGIEAAPDYSAGIAGPEVVIEIAPGETGSQIANKLFELGVVKSSLAFFRIAVADSRSARIAPGEHRIETKIPAKQALEQLLDSRRIPNLIIVRDGERIAEVVKSLEEFGLSREEVLASLKRLKPPLPFHGKNLEGFLYPAHYSFNQGVSADVVIEAMLTRFEAATADVQWRFGKFQPHELLTIASLVQTEGTPDVFGKVAQVIYNRLERGMPLQFDSTVHFALNRRGEIRVSIQDTKIKSSYNTFINRGLPPGPIGSPNREAIDATLNPIQGDWLYFVTVKPFDTRFTSSYDEFLRWKAEYKENYKAGLFK